MTASHLDPKLARRLSGQCLGCPAQAEEGSDWCEPCGHRVRSQTAARMANRRERLRKEKRCLDCGDPVRSRGLVRCADCRKANRENRPSVTRDDRSVTDPGADPAPRGHFKLEADARSDTWRPSARYVGRDRRGAPSKEDRDDEIVRDVDYAIDELEKFKKAFQLARSEQVQAMPRVQREEARKLAFAHLLYAGRFVDDCIERE